MSIVTVVTPPAATLVTLKEAKAHVRAADFGDDDLYLSGLLAAAQAHLDGPGGWLGRSIARQTLELRVAPPCGPVILPYPPFVALVSVTYMDSAGTDQAVSLDDVEVLPWRSGAAVVSPVSGTAWPSMSPDHGLRLRYTAGYQPLDMAVAPIRHAMLLLVGHWYANRETVSIGNVAADLPWAVEALLSPLRLWSQ